MKMRSLKTGKIKSISIGSYKSGVVIHQPHHDDDMNIKALLSLGKHAFFYFSG